MTLIASSLNPNCLSDPRAELVTYIKYALIEIEMKASKLLTI